MIRVSEEFVPIHHPPFASGMMYRDGQNGKTIIIDPMTNTRNDYYDPSIQLSAEIMNIIRWAESKMKYETELLKSVENNPAVQEAYNNLQLLLTLSK